MVDEQDPAPRGSTVTMLLPVVPCLLLTGAVVGYLVTGSTAMSIVLTFASVVSTSLVLHHASRRLGRGPLEWYEVYSPRFFREVGGPRARLGAVVVYSAASLPVLFVVLLFLNAIAQVLLIPFPWATW